MRDNRTDADIEAISGENKARLQSFSAELNNIKTSMHKMAELSRS